MVEVKERKWKTLVIEIIKTMSEERGSKYKTKWEQQFPWLKPCETDEYRGICVPCGYDIKVNRGKQFQRSFDISIFGNGNSPLPVHSTLYCILLLQAHLHWETTRRVSSTISNMRSIMAAKQHHHHQHPKKILLHLRQPMFSMQSSTTIHTTRLTAAWSCMSIYWRHRQFTTAFRVERQRHKR